MTNTLDESQRVKEVRALFRHAPVDYIVHNDKNDINERKHKACIYAEDSVLHRTESKSEMAEKLIELFMLAPGEHDERG